MKIKHLYYVFSFLVALSMVACGLCSAATATATEARQVMTGGTCPMAERARPRNLPCRIRTPRRLAG